MNNLAIISDICKGSKRDRQETIEAYEEAFKLLPQVEIPVTHYIHGGMYAREVTLPPGIVVIGQLYRFDHMEVMVNGSVTVSMETGDARKLEGYNCFKALAGKRRVVYVHEETTWVTFHSTPPRDDGEQIQKFLTAKTYDNYLALHNQASRIDYDRLSGDNKVWLREVSEYTGDQMDMPIGYEHVYIAKSTIEGQGVFSSTSLPSGASVCPGRLAGKRTPAGRYANHAVNANAEMRLESSGDFTLATLRAIEADEEITINYRQVFETQEVLCQA